MASIFFPSVLPPKLVLDLIQLVDQQRRFIDPGLWAQQSDKLYFIPGGERAMVFYQNYAHQLICSVVMWGVGGGKTYPVNGTGGSSARVAAAAAAWERWLHPPLSASYQRWQAIRTGAASGNTQLKEKAIPTLYLQQTFAPLHHWLNRVEKKKESRSIGGRFFSGNSWFQEKCSSALIHTLLHSPAHASCTGH